MRVAAAVAALGLAFAVTTAARADDPSLDWSLGDRLQGAASIDATAAARPIALHVSLGSPCPRQPSFSIDHDDVTAQKAGACSFDLPAIGAGAHELAVDGDEHGEVDVEATDHVVVSVGDSVASGEGNPDSGAHPWLERRCHRSLRSGAARAARGVEAGDRHSVITFVPLACSGATIEEGLLHPYAGVAPEHSKGPLPPQIEELNRVERPIEALLISVGANDVNFGPFAQFCVFVHDCANARFDPEHPRHEAPAGTPTAAEVERTALARLPAEYDALAAKLEAHVAPQRTIIVEYFDPLRNAAGDTCADGKALAGITQPEAQWAQTNILAPLNATIHAAAARHGWQVVGGVADAFRRHGLCAGNASWITDPFASGAAELSLVGTLHPNEDGHLATATLIAPILAGTLGVASGVEQIGSGHRGYLRWPWLLVAFAAGAVVSPPAVRAVRRWKARH